MDYIGLFESMHPGFFETADIKGIPEDQIFAELIMDLRKVTPKPVPYRCPGNISFGIYRGDIEKVREAVCRVDEKWVQFYDKKSRVFCAFDRDVIVSFCILEDWDIQGGCHIGGPGCVGTVPEYRKKGIGLEMVRRATNVLIDEGFDLSWIHYTHLRHWYEKLGYQTVLRWNCRGFISA